MSDFGNKNIFAKNLDNQMKLRKIDRNKLCEDLGFKYSTVSEWLSARKYPRIDKIEKMANYFGILKSDLIEDKSNMSTIIKNRAEALCKEKGITFENMAADLNIDPNVLKEFDKTELESKVSPISEAATQAVHDMAIYLETASPYLMGFMDNRELSRKMSGKEIIGKMEIVEINPKDARLREIVSKIDSLPDSDRSSLLDQIENLLKFYYQTLLNNQKKEW